MSQVVLDLPLSIATLVCDLAECGWDELDPHSNPGHLLAVLAGIRSHQAGSPFQAEMVAVAGLTLRQALVALAASGQESDGPDAAEGEAEGGR